MIAYLLQGIGLGLVGAAQPGPFQTYAISQSLRFGWRRSLVIACAPLVSDGPIIALVLLVLSRVPPSLLRGLHFASGLFLFYLAWCAFRGWRRQRSGAPESDWDTRYTFLRAIAMNFLSPGPYVYWTLVTGPILLSGWRSDPTKGLAFLVGFYATLVGTFGVIILTFGLARRAAPRMTHALLGVSVLALAGFALHQLWLGVHG